MSTKTLPQDLEQKLMGLNKGIIEKINQGAHKDETKIHDVVRIVEDLFLAVPSEHLQFIYDQTQYLSFIYFDFYNTHFRPKNAPDPEGCHFNEWVVNGTKDIKAIQRNLGSKLNSILEQIGRYDTINLLEEGIGSVAEELRKKYREEAAERYLSIIKSRFDQSFRERDLSIVRYLHESEEKQHTLIEKRKQLNEIGRRFRGHIKQTFEFVNELPTLFNKTNPEFYPILFKEPVPIEQTYQEFADFIFEANRKLLNLRDYLSENKKYKSKTLFSLLGKVEGKQFYKQDFLDNVVRLAEEEKCESEKEIIERASIDIPEWAQELEDISEVKVGVHKQVYIGFNPVLNQKVAAKGIMDLENIGSNPGLQRYFKRREKIAKEDIINECREMLKLRGCRNISEIYYAEAHGNVFVIKEVAFEYSLEDRLKKLGTQTLPIKDTLDILAQAVEGLCQLYEKGKCHGDPKPSNLGFMKDGRVVWTDFGICSYIGAGLGQPGEREYVSHVLTRPPEMLAGYKHPVDNSEVWSMGMILYRMVFGEYPIPDDFEDAYNEFIRTGDFKLKDDVERGLYNLLYGTDHIGKVHDSIRKADCPEEIKEIMVGCLQIEPEERKYKNPLELKEALETAKKAL